MIIELKDEASGRTVAKMHIWHFVWQSLFADKLVYNGDLVLEVDGKRIPQPVTIDDQDLDSA